MTEVETEDDGDVPAPLLGVARVDGYVKPTKRSEVTTDVAAEDKEDVPAPLLGVARGDGFVKPTKRSAEEGGKDLEDVNPPC